MIEQKGVSGASLPVRSGTRLSPGWVLHWSRLTRWDFAPHEPQTPDLDADCESCVAPDSPNLSIVFKTGETLQHAGMRAQIHARSAIAEIFVRD